MVDIKSYHHATAAEHQKQFESSTGLFKQGYIITSLSVYRQGNVPRYAAVWQIPRTYPDWRAFHGLTPNEYQDFFDTWHKKKGYCPYIVTATGGGVMGDETNTPIFAGVFRKSQTPFIAKHNIHAKTFMETCNWAKKNSHILSWAAIYGGIDRRYAGIWNPVRSSVKWDYGIYKTVEGPEKGVPVQMQQNPSLQLSFVTRSPAAEYLAVYWNFHSDLIERHGLQ